MKAEEFNLEQFLKSNMLTLDEYDFQRDIDVFIKEMEKGLETESSIPMFPTFIEDDNSIPSNKPVLVLDAGGTNFRAAIVSFDDNRKVEIKDFRKRGMPGVEREYGKAEFFDTITDFITDIVTDVETIGFCFSYPMEKNKDKDGRLIHFSKEIKAPEVVGQMIGQGVIDSLERRGIKNIKKIVILNDTVATLLAGKAQSNGRSFDSYIGIILGTGLNACYSEKNSNIKKVSDLPVDERQIINTEVGSCKIMPYGDMDKAFRETTDKPESYHFEKMVSGGYLGCLWFFLLKNASEQGCFSEAFTDSINTAASTGASNSYDSSNLSVFLADKTLPSELNDSPDSTDIERAYIISKTLVDRAAYIAAVMIAAISIKTGKGKSPELPLNLCIDGSTFWKLTGLKEKIESFLKDQLGKAGIYFEITQIENAPVIGAAVAGLTN